ncbi:MAG: hypothetical protein BWZ02_00781 [Lentisphaerae bacterium ADurb.BinA184]|nr:MAG: hypothetical protein BWZ02_00781 [Lentisphaerae bacterium ADurb.BinA184]
MDVHDRPRVPAPRGQAKGSRPPSADAHAGVQGLRARLREEFQAEPAEGVFLMHLVGANLREFRRCLEPHPEGHEWEAVRRAAAAIAALAGHLGFTDLKQAADTVYEAAVRRDAAAVANMIRRVDALIPQVLADPSRLSERPINPSPHDIEYDLD